MRWPSFWFLGAWALECGFIAGWLLACYQVRVEPIESVCDRKVIWYQVSGAGIEDIAADIEKCRRTR